MNTLYIIATITATDYDYSCNQTIMYNLVYASIYFTIIILMWLVKYGFIDSELSLILFLGRVQYLHIQLLLIIWLQTKLCLGIHTTIRF